MSVSLCYVLHILACTNSFKLFLYDCKLFNKGCLMNVIDLIGCQIFIAHFLKLQVKYSDQGLHSHSNCFVFLWNKWRIWGMMCKEPFSTQPLNNTYFNHYPFNVIIIMSKRLSILYTDTRWLGEPFWKVSYWN